MVKSKAEECVKEGLTLTKQLHKEIGESGIDPAIAKRLKGMVAETNKLLVNLRRQMAADWVVVTTREQILKQVLKEELIDRDANAARVAERMRLASEKGHGISTVGQRSDDAVQQMNASIGALCPWQIGLSASVPMIAAVQDDDGS